MDSRVSWDTLGSLDNQGLVWGQDKKLVGGEHGAGESRRKEHCEVEQKTWSLCWSPSPVLGKHMRSSIRGIHQECCFCQNYSVTLQGKFNKAPTAKTHWFPSLCQGCSRDTQWMPHALWQKRHQPSRQNTEALQGCARRSSPVAGSWGQDCKKGNYGPGTLRTSPALTCRERTSKGREIQESLFRVCYKQEGHPPHTSRTLLSHPCTSPTGQPLMSARFPTLCIQALGILYYTVPQGNVCFLPFSLTGDQLQHLNWKKRKNKKNTWGSSQEHGIYNTQRGLFE